MKRNENNTARPTTTDYYYVFSSFTFTGIDPRKGWRTPLNQIKCSEQRDEETGYGYSGARYMDYELMTMWLSVKRYHTADALKMTPDKTISKMTIDKDGKTYKYSKP